MLVVVSHTGDYHTDLIVQSAVHSGIAISRINCDDFPKFGTIFHTSSTNCIFEKLPVPFDATNVRAVIWRRPKYMVGSAKSFSWADRVVAEEWLSALHGALWTPGVMHINSPALVLQYSGKLSQVRVAKRFGLPVPPTIISNNLEKLLEFCNCRECITKSIGSGVGFDGDLQITSSTQRVDIDVLKAAGTSGFRYPVLLQEYVLPAAHWRVMYVHGQLFSVRMRYDGFEQEIDSRFVEQDLKGSVEKLPDYIANRYIAMCSAIGLNFASSDFIEDVSGNIMFIDLNPEGQWAVYEDDYGLPISAALVNGTKIERALP